MPSEFIELTGAHIDFKQFTVYEIQKFDQIDWSKLFAKIVPKQAEKHLKKSVTSQNHGENEKIKKILIQLAGLLADWRAGTKPSKSYHARYIRV